MKKIALLLAFAVCISFVSCSFTSSPGGSSNGGKHDTGILSYAPTYTLSFDTNGGSFVSSKNTSMLYEAPVTTREDHEFCGWYRDEGLSVPVVYPMKVESDVVLYAKWLRVGGGVLCTNKNIKFWDSNYNSSVLYDLTPSGFDIAALASAGYALKIDVKYNVYYIKDYDVLWDIGYAGAPKYEIGIYNTEKIGKYDNDLTTSTSSKTRTFSYKTDAANLMKTNVYLEFSTDNIQNIICFRDIEITYTFYK